MSPNETLADFMQRVQERNPGQPEFLQAVEEVAESILPFEAAHPEYREARILERMTEPDRVVMFRVVWQDDNNRPQINRGYRVQFNNSIGPYKGGLRFHPSVNLSILKFLGFEQVFKNSLTTLPMGGAKGGADFDPKGRSNSEVMRFCQSYMTELVRHIGADVDVPAGDIGVGAREIGYLFGQYKRLSGNFSGTLTGKGLAFGGSLIRAEATGYGSVYFVQEMLHRYDDAIEGKVCLVSGSGNVAQFTAEKLLQLGGKVVTMSDSAGTIYDAHGIDQERLDYIKELKNVRRGRLREYAKTFNCEYLEGHRPWRIPGQLAFPSATQNELSGEEAEILINNGLVAVGEGANMPTDPEGIRKFRQARVLYGLGKAANAGGVSVSGLEQTQNAMRLSWSREEVDGRLQDIMRSIHAQCVNHGRQEDGHVDYVHGANIAGYKKVADAMLAYGMV